jgi:mono/diheme cytochrome c family protein
MDARIHIALINRRLLPGLLTVLLMAVAWAPALLAQTSKPKINLRPLTRDDIAAYKLPATTQYSAGLATVGVGQPAYLEALVDAAAAETDVINVTWSLVRKPASSQATLTESPLSKDVPIYEPSSRTAYQLAGRALLRPDAPGTYTVTVSVETKTGRSESALMITAGEYIGAQSCSGCHNGGAVAPWNMSGEWEKTGHAHLFKNGVNGVASDHYGAGCIACHTVGYDPNAAAVNGGFDDIAKKYNWTVPAVADQHAGVFDALPEDLKNVANIQCENCHGPGSRHVASGGNPLLISVSKESGVCGQCHAALTHHSKTGEWLNSAHAAATREPSGEGHEGCVGCHTGTGFIARIDRAKTVDATYAPINCQTCHEPHGDTTPAGGAMLVRTLDEVRLADGTVIKDGGKGLLCMNCHQSRRNAAVYAATTAGSARFGPHHSPQADMLQGTNGFTYGKNIPTSAHAFVVEDSCVSCHMQAVEGPELTHAGGHTFKPASEAGENGERVELVEACQKCHGAAASSFNFALLDYDNDGEVEGVQTEVKHLLDKLSTLLPPFGAAKEELAIDASWTRPQLQAAYNWQFVKYDGSYGVHNMVYAVGLLKASIADLEKNQPK